MPLSARLLLAATALCCFTSLLALPLDGFVTDHRCRCLNTTRSFIPFHLFRKFEMHPPKANCRFIEVIITKKDNSIVCVAPDAEWIKPLVTRFIEKRRSMLSPVSTSRLT